jgi:hypothetical protein
MSASNDLKEEIHDKYGEIAAHMRIGQGGCCSPATACCDDLTSYTKRNYVLALLGACVRRRRHVRNVGLQCDVESAFDRIFDTKFEPIFGSKTEACPTPIGQQLGHKPTAENAVSL